MNKKTKKTTKTRRKIAARPTSRVRLKHVTPPVIAPSPAVIRRLLFEVVEHYIELLLFVVLQALLGLRTEEAYVALSDPWKYIHGDTFFVIGRYNRGRTIRIRPTAWAWLIIVPGFADGTKKDFRVFKNGKPLTVSQMSARVYRLLRAAGFSPAGPMPCEPLRKAKITALLASGESPACVAKETGHPNLLTMHRHVDASWSRTMSWEFDGIHPSMKHMPPLPPSTNPKQDNP